ncbi:pectin lyase-like protein [Coniochaeta ligniaria NRRL 30616]|uniref:pectinesterase n=1 Tax=Coniochaeta ligniaria NRRL 30616 TaxID=1408157 RepID=A0A1J7ITT8_9PEZI|nr:pectin lyase-like protein [Coniochaeta ligniaria NRRL 30616]
MRLSLLFGVASLAGIVACQNSVSDSNTTVSTSAPRTTSLTASLASSSLVTISTSSLILGSSTVKPTAVTVATDGSAQFTAINAAVSAAQISAIPSVVVKAGTYSEAVIIQGSQTITIVGPTATNYAGNQVVIVAAAPTTGVVSFNTQKSQGVTFKNVNITNTATGNVKAPAVVMSGVNMAFYGCALVSAGQAVYQASYGTTLIANSYIEGTDKLFYNYITLYVYGSTIVPTAASATIFYGQGIQISGVWYDASIVVDSSTVTTKPGNSNTYVYLASPNGNYTTAVYRNNALGSLIAPSGVKTTSCSYVTYYGEFQNTGAGAMTSSNTVSRNSYCDLSLSASQVSGFTIDQVFGKAFPGFSSYDTTWVDSSVLSSIQSSDSAQVSSASSVVISSTLSSTSSSTSAAYSAATTSSTITSSSIVGNSSAKVTCSGLETTATSVSSTSSSLSIALTSSSASSTIVVASAVTVAADGTAQFTDINAAVVYAQNSGIPSVVVESGSYPALTITGTQTVTISGPTATAYSENQVVVSASTTAGALSFGTSNSQGVTFRNLNFTNTATSGTAPAVNMKGINMAFYGCSLVSGGVGVYSSSYGFTLIANTYVEGSDKLFYNYPTVYLFQSTIVPTASSASIFYAKGALINNVWYNSTIVVDSSSVVQRAGLANTNVYLATPNGVNNYTQAIYRNTVLGSLIAASGVYSTSCSVIALYGEFETTGAGAYSSNAAARAAACDQQLTADQVSSLTIDKVFGSAFYGYSNAATSWIDATVLSAILSSDAAQVASASSSALSASGTATATASTTSTSGSATCAIPSPSSTLVVSLNATNCQYRNVSAAIAALPNDSKPYTIMIMPGTYTEQLSITRNGKVTLVGQSSYVNDYSQNEVTIQISNGQLTSAGQDESTPVIYAKKTNDNSGMAVYNINFINTYPQTTNTAALAADFYGANIAAYGCKFVGFQDTLLANKGTQVFSNCYIEGSIDFIWGFSTAYFHQCYIATNTNGACIAAQSRTAGTISGYVFDSCYVTYTNSYGSSFGLSYLGRPYNNYSTAIYMNSYIDKHINAAGWKVWSTSNPQTSNVNFGEYNNTGPGSWQAGTARASFATSLTDAQASAYTLTNWIGDTTWIDMTAYNYAPSFNWTATASATSPSTTSISSGSTATASVNAHPDSGTEPPQYAVIVSTDGRNGSFTNLTAAMASLPSDSTNQTIFMYAGTYTEQVPSINRPGAVRIIGYTTGNPGRSYQDNQVTLTFARGLSVSPLPSGHSDAETATVSTASNRISFYNIDIINSDNLDGSQASYVTLAASVYGNDIGFYGCTFIGWQDTLLNGATTGYQYYESCYIEGATDFIWGYSKAYFKGCTIGAKKSKSAMTAQSRASSSAIGGYIFDQCLFTQSASATTDLTNTVYLGRPYSAYALVVVKNSYIDDVINPSGWKVWSATDPRTDHITFAEFNNSGPSNWENNVAARQAFQNATLLTSDTYPLSSVMDSTSWIDLTYFDSITTPQPSVANGTSAANITVSGSSAYNGTVPPAGALVVSQSAIDGVTTYGTIQAALDAAPTSSKTNATIFIYPGTYHEQLIVNKSGTTIFMGYSDATDDYSQNQVVITQSYGEDTQGTGSDVDAATVYATGNYFYAYNINFRNDNGTQQNIASLGFAVKSSKFAFMHGCQIYGNQDTLYISGNMFAFKTYIEGNVDFIFGGGSGYFLNSTISPNEDGDSITAAKRTTNTTKAGFVFDQCRIVPANGASGFKNVSLGRPWNNNAQVVYVDSYLDSMVGSAGWVQWSKSSPQTDGVVFGEYHNYGPGSNTCKRAAFSEQLTDAEVVQYQLANFFTSTSWIDFSVIDVQPFVAGIGSAPAACANTTVSLSTASSTTSPLVTAYFTRTLTDKETTTTTLSLGDVSSTSTVVVTENDGNTVTPAAVLKTSTLKATSVVTSTSTRSAKATTVKSTATSYLTSTISAKDTTLKTTIISVATTTASGKPTTLKSTDTAFVTTTLSGKDTTIKSTSTILGTTTMPAKTTTLKATTTSFVVSISTPKATTVTDNEGGIVTVYKTSSQKATTVTSVITISRAAVTKTTTLKVTPDLSYHLGLCKS